MTATNIFDLFGLPTAYGVDLEQLEAAYQRLTLEHHPDFVANAPEAEQQQAQQKAAEVNEGYRVLRSDPLRSAYLLALLAEGEELNREELPEGFLLEMFSLQEELDELEDRPDTEQQRQLAALVTSQLKQVRETRAELFEGLCREMEQQGKNNRPGDIAALQQMQSNLNCEKYLLRLEERLG